MAAQKLPMPGLRDRTGGEEGEDLAAGRGFGVFTPSHGQRGVGNENGCAAPVFATGGRGEQQQQQARCSNSSTQAGLASSIMQPLPLASRYVGAAKQDAVHPASSALGSIWIRRFLPAPGGSTGAELGKEVTRAPTAVGWEGREAAGGGWEYGSQPAGPLLLAAVPNEQYKEHQQQREGGMAKAWMGHYSSRDTSGKVSRNGEYIPKGKGPLEREEKESRQETTVVMDELADNGAKETLRKVSTPPSHAGGAAYSVEGSSKLLQQHEGNYRAVLSTRGESHARLTGFGPFQVPKKPPASDYGKVGASGGGPKMKGMDVDARVEADARTAAAQPDAHRFSSDANDLLDRKPSGTSTMASQTGTQFTPPSKFKPLEDPWSGRPSCAVEFAGAWGIRRLTKKEDVEPDVGGGRPFMAQLDEGGAGETVAVVGEGGGLKVCESAARFNPFGEGNSKVSSELGHNKCLDHESGVDKIKTGSSRKFNNGDVFVSSHPPANLGRKEDGGQARESKIFSWAAEDAGAMLNAGAGLPTGLENRKMKGVVGSGFRGGRHTVTGPLQLPHSQEIPSDALHPLQGDFFSGKVGHPLPFSPHSSFPGEDISGEDTRTSRGRADRAKSPLTPLFGAPKVYEDGMDARATQSEQHPPWTSLYAAFKGLKHADGPNSSASTPTLPLDVHSGLQDGSVPANRPLEGHNANGNRDEGSGGGGRGSNEAHFPASPEARSRFDNQSSHFSSSPWPDDEGHIPNDDAGSGPNRSQATGSDYHSQAIRVATRTSSEYKGKHMSTYGCDPGSETEGPDKAARNRESSASEPELRKYADIQGKDEGQHISNGRNQAHVPSIPIKHSPTQAASGHKDDTSDSSPPSYPAGYYSTDSPLLPRGIVDEHLLSFGGKLKNVEVDSEMEGSRVPRMRKGIRRDEVGFAPKRTKESMNSLMLENDAVFRGQKEVLAFPSKDLERVQPLARDINRQGRSNEGLEPGLRNFKLRTSGEAMGECGISIPSKRTRLNSNLGSNYSGSPMAGSGMPSSWLTRWLPASTGSSAKSPAGFARPKDDPRNEPPRSNGNTKFTVFSDDRSAQARTAEFSKGKETETRNETKSRNVAKGFSATLGLLALPPHPVPSAAAMALVGTAARKMGPFPQQRMGPVAMWPPVHLHTAQAPEGSQRSS